MMHDLKNSVAQLQLIVANAERHKHNPEFIDDAIDTIANAVERMTRLIEQLRGATATGSRCAAGSRRAGAARRSAAAAIASAAAAHARLRRRAACMADPSG